MKFEEFHGVTQLHVFLSPSASENVSFVMINFDDFLKLDLKVAKVIEVEEHPNADKLCVLKVDIGGEERQLVAGIKQFYSPDELKDKLIVVLTNLEPKTIRGVESHGMLLAAKSESDLCLVVPQKAIREGSKIS